MHMRRERQVVGPLLAALESIGVLAAFLYMAASQSLCASAASRKALQTTNFPPLRIESSGRLPQQAQGLSLGMSVAQALSSEANLQPFSRDEKIDPVAPQVGLFGRTARGFDNMLLFEHGSLVHIDFGLTNISPADTAALLEDTLAQLGPPTKTIWNFPETSQLLWIDGDVRISYSDQASGSARQPRLEIVDWPVYRRTLLSARDELVRHQEMVQWGEETFAPKSLPREFAGVQLGMRPWQMRAALGSSGLERSALCDAGCQCWIKNLRGSQSIDLTLWQDQVITIHEELDNIKAGDIPRIENQWLDRYGMPLQGSDAIGDFAWTDGQVKLDCMFSGARAEGRVQECYMSDLHMLRIWNARISKQTYSPAPSFKSFF